MGITRLLEDTPLSREQLNYVKYIKVSADALMGVINDILDFSKVEAGKLDFEVAPFRVADVVPDVIALLSQLARDKGITLQSTDTHEAHALVLGDARSG